LDSIGDFDEDYGGDQVMAENNDDEMDIVNNDDDATDEETEVAIGYSEKRTKLWMHMKFAEAKGEISWLKHADVCRPETERDPYGQPGPWNQYYCN
jgi:hypothetical protein